MENIVKNIKRELFTGERALFKGENLFVEDCIFADGESPLKESRGIELLGSMFKWKYPLWYAKDIRADNCIWFEGARAGVWYSENVVIENTPVEAPKNFRRCRDLTLNNVTFTNALETLWHCNGVKLDKVYAKGDYFLMDSENITVDNLTLQGNYSFDGVKNVTVRNSKLLTKDAFWNSENVTVYDSLITGEYLGWNAKNLTFVNCTIESLQGLCYIENLTMRNCKLINTTLSFEYSTVDADIEGGIKSVLNPTSGRIICDSIGELILEKDNIDPDKTVIICREKDGSTNV